MDYNFNWDDGIQILWGQSFDYICLHPSSYTNFIYRPWDLWKERYFLAHTAGRFVLIEFYPSDYASTNCTIDEHGSGREPLGYDLFLPIMRHGSNLFSICWIHWVQFHFKYHRMVGFDGTRNLPFVGGKVWR